MSGKLTFYNPTCEEIAQAIVELEHDAYLLAIVDHLSNWESGKIVNPGDVYIKLRKLRKQGFVSVSHRRIGIIPKVPVNIFSLTEKALVLRAANTNKPEPGS